MNNDLWGDLSFESFNSGYEENRAYDILKEQARLIGTKTNGLVRGSLFKMSEFSDALSNALESFSKTASKIKKKNEISGEDLDQKDDINNRFRKTVYRFEVYSADYRFRVLILYNSEEFPIEVAVDEGIKSELHYEDRIVIKNNIEFQECIRNVLSCEKMRIVLQRMMESSFDIKSEEIREYLKTHSEYTLKDMGKELGMSQSTIHKLVNKMCSEGKLVKELINSRIKYHIVDDEK